MRPTSSTLPTGAEKNTRRAPPSVDPRSDRGRSDRSEPERAVLVHPVKTGARQISGLIGWRERQARGKQGLVHIWTPPSHHTCIHRSPHRHAMGLEPPLQRQQEPGPASAPHADGGGAADRVEQVCMYVWSKAAAGCLVRSRLQCAAMHGCAYMHYAIGRRRCPVRPSIHMAGGDYSIGHH